MHTDRRPRGFYHCILLPRHVLSITFESRILHVVNTRFLARNLHVLPIGIHVLLVLRIVNGDHHTFKHPCISHQLTPC